MTTLAQNIRYLRQSRALRQANVARMIGVPRRVLSSWEHGIGTPPPAVLERLREVFGDTALLDVERVDWAEARRELGSRG